MLYVLFLNMQMGKKKIFFLFIFKSIIYFYRPTYVEPLYIVDNDGFGLQGVSGLATDSNDRIFISDTGHHRIVICTPEGGYITHIGVEGNGPGELKRPCGLDITADGTIV